MAAPGATFRWLLPLSRALPSRPGLAAIARPYGVRASETGELVTHTGQVYDEKDYRRVRFVGRQKEPPRPCSGTGKLVERSSNGIVKLALWPGKKLPVELYMGKGAFVFAEGKNPFSTINCCALIEGTRCWQRIRMTFGHRPQAVNKNFAIDLIAEQPVSQVESRVISCDGGGGALGHPKVYINLDKDTKTGTCGYCGLQFKQKHH